MIKKALITIFFLALQNIYINAQVGVHTNTPDNSSAMDIVASNRGLLIPRVTLTNSLSNPSPVTAPAVGLLVFNSGANQPIGFYYWNGSAWVAVSGGSSPSGDYWSLTGNAGTIPGTNFLGTTDNNNFLVYTNNAERIRFEPDGQVIVGGTTPQAATHMFTVYGNTTQNFAIATFSPTVGYYNLGGRYGVFSQVDTACTPNPGYALYARNTDASGYGIYATGSNVSSLPLITNHTAAITSYGFDGLHAWGRNTTTGHGICAIGSGLNSSFALSNISAGVSAIGNYGIIAKGSNASGRGIVAVGSGLASPSTSNESEGGAFVGNHGIFAKGSKNTEPLGVGVIGIGYNSATYSTLTGYGLGGSFTGDYGIYGKGISAVGVGVLGLGSNGPGYYTVTNGSGGAFTGYHGSLSVGTNVAAGIGVLGAGNDGAYTLPPAGAGGSFTGNTIGAIGYGSNDANGVGIIGSGNNSGSLIPANGAGGSFSGNTGLYSKATTANGTGVIGLGNNIALPGTFANGAGGTFTGTYAGSVNWGADGTGTGVIGAGSAVATPLTYASGSGGAFTGTEAGVVGYGITAASGVGVIGAGNNLAPTIPVAVGCGGAFTGVVCGVYGNATQTNGLRYGGYFATTNGQYAYVGGRNNNTNQKIIGTGTVSTIVKSTEGELITLYCPEAPEVLFQDYGIGQLVNGFAHINIDPDLAINITVNDSHPLKVFVTLEGDCNGVYVTNKTSNGFDVVELQGGTSNVQFAWQIVATRANEEYVLRDGSIETSDYSQRFAPAPGPMESYEQTAVVNQKVSLEVSNTQKVTEGKGNYKLVNDQKVMELEPLEDKVIEKNQNDEN